MEQAPIDERQTRINKIAQLRDNGIDPYPARYTVTHSSAEIKRDFKTLSEAAVSVSVAGRVMLKRVMGKASFLTIKDSEGALQIYVERDALGEDAYNAVFKKLVDAGDIVGVTGEVFKTKTEEITVHAKTITMLSKSINTLPEKFHGLTDTETRYRKRYLDLIMNEKTKADFVMRSRIIKLIRDFMDERGFLEVETPMMHSIPGGAKARPFVTHHNALDMDLYLRIAPELYLKRLVVGGMERVFEINRSFRNEGVSTRHNPEFTMLEAYQAYADYTDMMRLTEELFAYLCDKIKGKREFEYQGKTLSFNLPWERLSMSEAVKRHTGVDFALMKTDAQAREATNALGIDFEKTNLSKWECMAIVFEAKVEERLFQPVFITDFPEAISPLAKRNAERPELAERFEVMIAGREHANAFSELNDPVEQREKFEAQVAERAKGDDEAMFMDADYITALEHAMPPAGGLGIGIDRLVMLFIDTPTIRDTILFPHMRKAD